MNRFPPLKPTSLACVCLVVLSGCSVLQTDKVDYKSASELKAPELSVPPDMTQLSKTSRYAIVDGGVSASSLKKANQLDSTTTVAAPNLGDARFVRDGSDRWITVDRPPEALWDTVRAYWRENGIPLVTDEPALGVMETEWVENRAKIPLDGIRAMLGKMLDSLYSTAERDKYRMRLERNARGGSDIFITHRGMQEVYTQERSNQTMWQPRPSDPSLEVEMLRRLMIKLGTPAEQAQQQTEVAATTPQRATLQAVSGVPSLLLSDDFDRAWRRVALTLDRTGFTVEDRDRKQGVFFVRITLASSDNSEPGFFARVFSGAKAAEPAKYRIALKTQNTSSLVQVQDESGQPNTGAAAERILKILQEDLR